MPDTPAPLLISARGRSPVLAPPPARPRAAELGPLHEPFPGEAPPGHWYLACKPAVDFVLALGLALLTAPVVALAALVVKLTSRGPAFYTQTRVGLGGRPFTIYKLRTMRADSERATGAAWSGAGDPRVTPVGRLLRTTHVDEFPQLLNVLRGDMSLTGPRPERPEIVAYLQGKVAGYTERLRVRPGITGLAQVQLPPDTCLEGVRRKLVCDLYSIEHFGAWLEWRVLLCTGLFLLGVPLAVSRKVLQVPEPLAGLGGRRQPESR